MPELKISLKCTHLHCSLVECRNRKWELSNSEVLFLSSHAEVLVSNGMSVSAAAKEVCNNLYLNMYSKECLQKVIQRTGQNLKDKRWFNNLC